MLIRLIFFLVVAFGATSCSVAASICGIDLSRAAEAEEVHRIRGQFLVGIRHGSAIVDEKCPGSGAPVEDFEEPIAPDFYRSLFVDGGQRMYEVDVTAVVFQGGSEDPRPTLRILKVHSFHPVKAESLAN